MTLAHVLGIPLRCAEGASMALRLPGTSVNWVILGKSRPGLPSDSCFALWIGMRGHEVPVLT